MTPEELKGLMMRLSIYEGFFKKFMHAKPEEFEGIQRKAIEIGPQLGIPYTGETGNEFQENTIYGDILITAKRLDEAGNFKYNIARVDGEHSIIADSRKMDVPHEEFLQLLQEYDDRD